jgi:glycerol-3-phosphate acyltransferase PlsY
MVAMAAVLAGHIFPIPWRSVGGTGMAVMMGTTAGLLPLGAVIAAAPALLFIRVTHNTGYAGLLFFLLTVAAGGLAYRDAVGVGAVLLGAAAVFVKSLVQYRGR